MNQKFTITIEATTECEEIVSIQDVRLWIYEQFEGCDLAEIEIKEVLEK